MKRSIAIKCIISLIVLLGYGKSHGQQSDTLSEYDYWNYRMTFNLQGGAWIPIGHLNKTFHLNPNIGINWGFPITSHLRIAAGGSIYIPIKSEPFDYITADSTFSAQSKNTANGAIGVWLSHEHRIHEQVFWDKYFGLGLGFIQTDTKKHNATNDSDNFYDVQSINFNFGMAIRKIAFRKRSFGLFAEYNYAPYALFGKVNKDFGSSSIITGILFRF